MRFRKPIGKKFSEYGMDNSITQLDNVIVIQMAINENDILVICHSLSTLLNVTVRMDDDDDSGSDCNDCNG